MSEEEIKQDEILYNQLYERTKCFGRTQFIKEIMRLERENQQLKEQLKLEIKVRDDNHQYLHNKLDLYKSVIDELEKWLKDDLGVIYTAESMSGREFTTAKEVAVIDVLKKINELKGEDLDV